MLVSRDFKFDSAHFLPKYHGKCERLHGHAYRLRVTLKGEPDSEGMVCDFAEIKKVVKERVLTDLDHNNLNDVIENPSAENIAVWIWEKLSGQFPEGKGEAKLYEVKVWETENCFVSYRG